MLVRVFLNGVKFGESLELKNLNHVRACRIGIQAYANAIESTIPELHGYHQKTTSNT